MCGCFSELLCQAFTMASLSQQKQIYFLPCSHVVAAGRMANSSWHCMDGLVQAVDVVASCNAARHLQSGSHSRCYQKHLYRAGDPGLKPKLCTGTWPIHPMLEGTTATTVCLLEPGCLV